MSAPEPYWSDDQVRLYLGKCEGILPGLPPESVDAIVTDPPYGLREFPVGIIIKTLTAWLAGQRDFVPDGRGFMSRDWDRFVPPPAAWDECYRVLKPGGRMLVFAAPRTLGLMDMSIRLAGFVIEDTTQWIFGQGMPKSRARLKPAHEPIIMAQKPASQMVPLNVDECRVEAVARPLRISHGDDTPGKTVYASHGPGGGSHAAGTTDTGRWPPNVVLTHSPGCVQTGTRKIPGDPRAGQEAGMRPGGFGDVGADSGSERPNGPLHGPQLVPVFSCAPECPVAELDRQSGILTSGANPTRRNSDVFSRDIYGEFKGQRECVAHRGADSGGASRFFPVFQYEPKAAVSERPRSEDGHAHNTVKPLDLIRWKVRLITPPGGVVLDLFAGSGTTGEACIIEGFPCVLIEQDSRSVQLIRTRLRKPIQPDIFGGVA